ncbi:MAG: alpha/beta fold hydrolase [Acidobacteriia bacterium]|nr:alpha/beta fold hydrolase [Terriglobia bacterium]
MKPIVTSAVAAALAICTLAASPQTRALATREYFYITGKYAGSPGVEVMSGQMYVEVWRPRRVTRKYPLVFFHGASQTATNWMGTPDGRPGWADYFLGEGYVVYMVDQPARGRSAWHASTNGPLTILPASDVERRFTASEVNGTWPQAKKHTQWPGSGPNKGRRGDPVFDAFYASQVEGLAGNAETQTGVQVAGSALLDKIGPAIVVTHSQAGPFGWLLADARPALVKGIVAIEPAGPPFQNAVVNEDKARPWGITDIPIAYDPPVKSPEDLQVVRETKPDSPDLAACSKQADPPRRLTHLQGIPVLLVTTESSYHAPYDHCTAKFLTQAGVKNTYLRLETQGIFGNGHMVMLEKNNMEVAALLQKWISDHIQ